MPKKDKHDYEVIIVGGGPTGLSAALVLGRCLRKVLICDGQDYRNAASEVMHGYLTRDGISPKKFREIAHNELKRYGNVALVFNEVTAINKEKNGFKITTAKKQIFRCRKLLLAIGRKDKLPNIPHFQKFYGKYIFHCPYCDGYEWKGKALAVIGEDKSGYDYALGMLQWSKNILYCTNGKPINAHFVRGLVKNGIEINTSKILDINKAPGNKLKLIFKNTFETKSAIFFDYSSACPSKLLKKLGCKLDKSQSIIHNKLCVKNVEGLYVAGDACHEIFQAIAGAGQGVEAAIYINQALTTEDLK